MSHKPTDANALTTLLHTHIVGRYPTSLHHAYMCSAGSQGYNAVKEMLQNGKPGNTLLVETGDLRDVGNDEVGERGEIGCCVDGNPRYGCILYSFNENTSLLGRHYPSYIGTIPHHAFHLAVFGNTPFLPKNFLKGCHRVFRDCNGLTTIDFSPLSQVTVVEDAFLSRCTGLKTIDLSPLSHVTKIKRLFLSECSGLTTIDLSPLSQVIEVESSFLKGCTGLTTIDLSPLSQLKTIQFSFLANCKGLTKVDLTPFTGVTLIGGYFLLECTGLTSIDLTPLSNVVEIAGGFLMRCTGLTTIDMQPLTQLATLHFGSVITKHMPTTKLLLPAQLQE